MKLQQDLLSLQEWAYTWGMKFNASKCYILRVSRMRSPKAFNYQITGQSLKKVEKNLGVIWQSDMRWSAHVGKTTQRANTILAFLRRNLSHCPAHLKVIAYKSLVRSGLEYASAVWDPHLQDEIKKLEAVQRRAARFVCSDYGRQSSVTRMLERLEWDSLQTRRRTIRLTLFGKVLRGEVAVPTEDILYINRSNTRAGARGHYQHIRANTETYKQSFFPRTLKDWNELPINCTSATSADAFKQGLALLDP